MKCEAYEKEWVNLIQTNFIGAISGWFFFKFGQVLNWHFHIPTMDYDDKQITKTTREKWVNSLFS